MPLKNKLLLKEDEFGGSDLFLDPEDVGTDHIEEVTVEEPVTPIGSDESYHDPKWKKKYDESKSDAERNTILEGFLNAYLKSHSISKGKISKIRNELKRQLTNYGSDSLSEISNPFLKYLTKYNTQNDLSAIKESDYKNIENAYASGAINDTTLSGKGYGGLRNIIFNNSMLKRTPDDFNYLCQAYSWISRNTESLAKYVDNCDLDQLANFGKILGDEMLYSDCHIPEEYGGKGLDKIKADVKANLVNTILFDDGYNKTTTTNKDKIRPALNIYKAMDYLDDQVAPAAEEKTSKDDLLTRETKTLSDKELEAYKSLDDEKARDLIAYLLKTHERIKI